MKKNRIDDEAAAALGCMTIIICLLGVAWVGFLAWLLYTLITWLVTK